MCFYVFVAAYENRVCLTFCSVYPIYIIIPIIILSQLHHLMLYLQAIPSFFHHFITTLYFVYFMYSGGAIIIIISASIIPIIYSNNIHYYSNIIKEYCLLLGDNNLYFLSSIKPIFCLYFLSHILEKKNNIYLYIYTLLSSTTPQYTLQYWTRSTSDTPTVLYRPSGPPTPGQGTTLCSYCREIGSYWSIKNAEVYW